MTASDPRPLLMLDHDGVVVDSLDVFSSSFIDACRLSGIPGVETPEDVLALFEENVYDSLRARGVDDSAIREAVRRTAGALRNALPWLKPFPLMPQILDDLGETHHVAIVTSNDEDVVTAFLRRHAVTGVAEVVGARAGQSKAAKIESLIARFPAQQTYWFVGDTAGDMREARRAGATPLGVAWGWHDPDLLLKTGAQSVVGTPADLLAVVAPELAADFLGTSGE
jgi:phosphoglycolate phosphatase